MMLTIRFRRLVKAPLKGAWVVLAVFSLVPTAAIALAVLARHLVAIRRADVIIVGCDGGFGHTITVPDLARRLFREQRIVVLFYSFNPYHNPKVRSLFRDVRVVFVPTQLGGALPFLGPRTFFNGRVNRPYQALTSCLLYWILFGIAKDRQCVMRPHHLYQSIVAADTPYAGPTHHQLAYNHRWPMVYQGLMVREPAPPVRLPERMRWRVRQALNRVAGPQDSDGAPRLCCLYLRLKNVTTSKRNGPPIEEYTEGIRELNRAGYQVLLTGDAELPRAMEHAFGGMLVDARHAGVDPEMFWLYAATEADIFVGQNGGGAWLPGINGIPRLVVQALPYTSGFPNSWMYYKGIRDEGGSLVPYQRLFEHCAYEYEFPGMTIVDNTGSEIRDAIVSFLEDVEGQRRGAELETQPFAFPPHTWAWYGRARISTAWLRKYADASAHARAEVSWEEDAPLGSIRQEPAA